MEIPSRDWITEADHVCMWYSNDELKRVREELSLTIYLMATAGSIPKAEEENLCVDGLQTPDEYEQRTVVAREAIQEVLLEHALGAVGAQYRLVNLCATEETIDCRIRQPHRTGL